MRKYLEYHDNKSSKFWEIEVDGKKQKVCFGKITANGQTQVKEFDSTDLALKDAEKQIKLKLKKGYAEIAAGYEIN